MGRARRIGRTILIAAVSTVVALALALFMSSQVEHHLIEGELRFLTRIAEDLTVNYQFYGVMLGSGEYEGLLFR